MPAPKVGKNVVKVKIWNGLIEKVSAPKGTTVIIKEYDKNADTVKGQIVKRVWEF